MKRKTMPGLKDLAELPREILGGIASEFLEIDPLLRAIFFNSRSNPGDTGFHLKRRQVDVLVVTLRGCSGIALVRASYVWRGRIYPQRPAEKPGYVYPAYKADSSGSWMADLQDPIGFQDWTRLCISHINERIAYADEKRAKVIQMRRFREEQREIARAAAERYRQRFEEAVNAM